MPSGCRTALADDYVPGPDAPARLLLHCAQKSAQVGAIGGVALAAVGVFEMVTAWLM